MHHLLFISAFLASIGSVKANNLTSFFDRKILESSSFCKKYGCKLLSFDKKYNKLSYRLTKAPIIQVCALPNFQKCHLNTSDVSKDGYFAKDINFTLVLSHTPDSTISLFIQSFAINNGYFSLKQLQLIDFFADFLRLVSVKTPQKVISNIINKCNKAHYGKPDKPGVLFCNEYDHITTFNQKGLVEFRKGHAEGPGTFVFELTIVEI